MVAPDPSNPAASPAPYLGRRPQHTPMWTPHREHLCQLLEDLHPDAAEFYRQAVEALHVKPLVRVRLMIASHCVRELMPSLLEMQGIDTRGRADVNRVAKDLFEVWQDRGLTLDPDAVSSEQDDAPYTVPGAVFRRAQAVAAKGVEANDNARAMTALVATGVAETADDAPVRRVHTAIEHFRKWTHRHTYGRPQKPLPSAEFVESEFRVIEQALLSQLAHRGDHIRELRRILAAANTKVEDGS